MKAACAAVTIALLFAIPSAFACTVSANATPPAPGMHFDTVRCKWVQGPEPALPIWNRTGSGPLTKVLPPQHRFGQWADTWVRQDDLLSDRRTVIRAAP